MQRQLLGCLNGRHMQLPRNAFIRGILRYPTGSSNSGVLRLLSSFQDVSLEVGFAVLQAAAGGVLVAAMAAAVAIRKQALRLQH